MTQFNNFLIQLNESAQNADNQSKKYRMQKLAGLKIEDIDSKYCILVSFGNSDGKTLITEHEKYKSFEKTTNRFLYHPSNPDIPVQAHYHIYPKNGNLEIYSVNMDGTAHHKKNRGYEVPKKEAEELRRLGVKIPSNRIIENREIDWLGVELDQFLLLLE